MTLRDLGLRLVRRVPGLDPLARRVYAALPGRLHDEPTSRVRRFFRGREQVSFVQVGAYDGLAGDPLRPLIVGNAGWRGVLVEPQPGAFAALVRNYEAQAARLHFVNAAVAPETGERTLYVVPAGEMDRLGLPDWMAETASFSRAHVAKHAGHCRIEELTVPATTFADVADRLPGGRVDLVVIDVEGYEKAVLDSIDLDRHRTAFVVFEHKHLPGPDLAATIGRLEAHGFATKEFGRDTIAWRETP